MGGAWSPWRLEDIENQTAIQRARFLLVPFRFDLISCEDSFEGLQPGPKDEALRDFQGLPSFLLQAYFAKGDFAANGEAFRDLAKDFGAAVELLPLGDDVLKARLRGMP